MGWSWVLVVVGALLVLTEVALGGFAGFDLVLIGSAFVLGGACGLLLHSAPLGMVAVSVFCLAYIAFGRRWLRARVRARLHRSNADALLGRPALVLKRVAAHEAGQVRVGAEVWRAVLAPGAAGPLEPGTEVTVDGLDGVSLEVR